MAISYQSHLPALCGAAAAEVARAVKIARGLIAYQPYNLTALQVRRPCPCVVLAMACIQLRPSRLVLFPLLPSFSFSFFLLPEEKGIVSDEPRRTVVVKPVL